MPTSHEDESPGDNYFNDLTRQPSGGASDEAAEAQDDGGAGSVPKTKRIACVLCRRRKLKCDGTKPACGTCARLQHDCSYDEVRRKSGPKRGYVRALEARLAQVETLLRTQDSPPAPRQQMPRTHSDGTGPEYPYIGFSSDTMDIIAHGERAINSHVGPQQAPYPHAALGATASGDQGSISEESCPWEMIGLGLDEPLPTADAVRELTAAYFDKFHLSLPMIHRPRYYAAMNLAPHMRPPVCLRYAMWAMAASVTDKYEAFQEHFYHRARKYIQQDEMKGHGESMLTIAHAQTWVILASYEFKLMYFPRAWMSAGRACRMVQMMGLHRLDGVGLEVKQCLPPPKDWTEREERRRTFWGGFAVDRYSSIGTGWPMTIEERDIMTVMPCEDEAYDLGRAGKSMTFKEALNPESTPKISSFGGVVLMACLFGRNLTHLHRPGPDDKDDDINGAFWRRHREMDNILLKTAMMLPDSLRLPAGINNPNIIFLNMNVHTSAICLHQAAIFKADKNRLPARIAAESKVRCITAAAEIASIMRQISHLDLSAMNPFTSFCLYVAARVFVQYLKSRPNDSPVRASLQFLLSAMHAIKRKNPLTESFIVQLDVDLEGAGLENTEDLRAYVPSSDEPSQAPGCPMAAYLSMQPVTHGDGDPTTYDMSKKANHAGLAVPSTSSGSFGYEVMSEVDPLAGFAIPNRTRTPGSLPGSMDTSPDHSGDQRTPSSMNQSSSRTSNTAYSPAMHQNNTQPGTTQLNPELFDPAAATDFNADFDMHNYTAMTPQSGFVLPQNWAAGVESTGLTPGATGMTPNATDMMAGLSEADWNQVLNGFQTWDPGMSHEGGLFQGSRS